jgi:phenolic acid decarboxylase
MHQLLDFDYELNLLTDNIHTTKKTEPFIYTSEEVGLKIIAEEKKVHVAVWSPECRVKS